jgi:hypothetical protein
MKSHPRPKTSRSSTRPTIELLHLIIRAELSFRTIIWCAAIQNSGACISRHWPVLKLRGVPRDRANQQTRPAPTTIRVGHHALEVCVSRHLVNRDARRMSTLSSAAPATGGGAPPPHRRRIEETRPSLRRRSPRPRCAAEPRIVLLGCHYLGADRIEGGRKRGPVKGPLSHSVCGVSAS